MSSTRHLRVFVSSTFVDMHEERERLAKEVFPKLRSYARQRQVEFTDIDLRWGITQQEAESGETLRVCLEEIYKCMDSPIFFIGILGYRYGWIPGELEERIKESLEKDPRFSGLLKDYPTDRTSITELEVRFGVFKNLRLNEGMKVFFYIRDEEASRKKLKELRIEQGEEEFKRVKEIIEELEELAKRHPNIQIRQYEDTEELASLVEEDLTKEIDRLFPADEVPDPLELVRIQHRTYGESRLKSYILDKTLFEEVLKFLDTEGGYLLITGESGVGRSSFMAYLARYLREKYKDALVIEHYTSAGSEAPLLQHILRRLVEELERFLGHKEEEDKEAIEGMLREKKEDVKPEEKLRDQVLELFHEASTLGKKVFVLLDG
ncbi:MAG: DUF4062 domain-containing protein, partial [Aquificaceae bacterium]|nr:DUF4062 domain-containing protein [Aquificaceae bacterium]